MGQLRVQDAQRECERELYDNPTSQVSRIIVVISFWICIIEDIMEELLRHIESIVWDNEPTDAQKIQSLQGLLYQWGANQDRKTEDLFGDDDAHISKRKF